MDHLSYAEAAKSPPLRAGYSLLPGQLFLSPLGTDDLACNCGRGVREKLATSWLAGTLVHPPDVFACSSQLFSSMQVVPLEQLEQETLVWCREMLRNSPTALRVLKSALNAAEDGQAGIQQLGGDATMLFYQSEEGNEGREAYLEKRPPNFSKFPRLP